MHSEAADAFAVAVEESGSPQGAERLLFLLAAGRRLDRGNADQHSIANDFGRLGITRLWERIDAMDVHGPSRRAKLDLLMAARNAIAHGNEAQMLDLRTRGVALNLAEAKRWRHALNGLAVSLDRLVAEYLATLFTPTESW